MAQIQSAGMSPEQAAMVKLTIVKLFELGQTGEFVGPLTVGPRLIYFGIRPTGATKISSLEGTAADLAVALRVEDVLVKRMPGSGHVGIYIPRPDPQHVRWLDLFGLYEQQLLKIKGAVLDNVGKPEIPLLLVVNWQGRAFVDDLTKCPHLPVAGSTGGGKSVLVRSLIASFTKMFTKSQLQLVLSDTKGVEFNEFADSSLLRYSTANTAMRTIEYMQELCDTTDSRLKAFGGFGVRNIQEYNQQESPAGRMPYIVLVIDELADVVGLSLEKGKATKIGAVKLNYLTRKSRAAGIHVIAAVQRPSVDVVKGVIKNNFPARLSFHMGSQVDSRVVLDTNGAEHLMRTGDCLYKGASPELVRIHTGLATQQDIKGVIAYVQYMNEQRKGLTQ